MSVVFSGSYSGTFTSTGNAQTIILPAGVDFMRVENETVSYAAGGGSGAEFFWRVGMPQGQGTQYVKTVTTNALAISQLAAGTGFYLFNNTINTPAPGSTISVISNATPPEVTTASSAGLIPNFSVVRLYNTTPGASQLSGIDFTVGTVPDATHFQLKYMYNIVTAGAITNGFYKIIPYSPYFYPSYRYITNITRPQDTNGIPGSTIVTMSVTHNYTVGQEVSLRVPVVTALQYGTTLLNDVYGAITQIGVADSLGYTNTIVVNIDSSSFGAFAFPVTAGPSFTPAMVIPVGESTATALNPLYNLGQNNILADATVNQGAFGIILQAGANSPAGVADDIISWQAFKSFNQ